MDSLLTSGHSQVSGRVLGGNDDDDHDNDADHVNVGCSVATVEMKSMIFKMLMPLQDCLFLLLVVVCLPL